MSHRLGRLAAVRPVGLADMAVYMGGALPDAPPAVSVPPVSDWGMLGNDRAGDCTVAAAAHLRMAAAAANYEPVPVFTTGEALAAYFALSGGADRGLVEADVLAVWRTAGLLGDRVAGYAPVDHRDLGEVRSVVAEFDGAYLGVVIPGPAQAQFAAGDPWDLTGTAADREVEGGHAVPAVGYDSDWLYVVTWGRVQRVSWRWAAAYLEEAWAVATSESDRVDHAALAADLARLG